MITVDETQSLNDVERSARRTQKDRPHRLTNRYDNHYGQNACDKNNFVHPTVALKIVEIIIDEVKYESPQQISNDDVQYERETFVQHFETDEQNGEENSNE